MQTLPALAIVQAFLTFLASPVLAEPGFRGLALSHSSVTRLLAHDQHVDVSVTATLDPATRRITAMNVAAGGRSVVLHDVPLSTIERPDLQTILVYYSGGDLTKFGVSFRFGDPRPHLAEHRDLSTDSRPTASFGVEDLRVTGWCLEQADTSLLCDRP
jgi:hypothetical protein